jgi:hypothetical protein
MLLCHVEPNVVGEPYSEHEYMAIIIDTWDKNYRHSMTVCTIVECWKLDEKM